MTKSPCIRHSLEQALFVLLSYQGLSWRLDARMALISSVSPMSVSVSGLRLQIPGSYSQVHIELGLELCLVPWAGGLSSDNRIPHLP